MTVVLFISSCQFDTDYIAEDEMSMTRQSGTDISPVKLIKDTGVIRYINLEGGILRDYRQKGQL
ncbi:MAG: hypothetical protein JXB88_25190 [Spirochaetales bacterium]|nr:hypothetical protein [Spirochaetales bacterium]